MGDATRVKTTRSGRLRVRRKVAIVPTANDLVSLNDLPTIAMLMTPLDLSELTDEFAIKIPEDRTVAKRCVAIEVLKRSRPKSRNGVNASFTGVVTSNVKHVQKMSNLQSVNNYERNETKSTHL